LPFRGRRIYGVPIWRLDQKNPLLSLPAKNQYEFGTLRNVFSNEDEARKTSSAYSRRKPLQRYKDQNQKKLHVWKETFAPTNLELDQKSVTRFYWQRDQYSLETLQTYSRTRKKLQGSHS
jgi:hypothetical protein